MFNHLCYSSCQILFKIIRQRLFFFFKHWLILPGCRMLVKSQHIQDLFYVFFAFLYFHFCISLNGWGKNKCHAKETMLASQPFFLFLVGEDKVAKKKNIYIKNILLFRQGCEHHTFGCRKISQQIAGKYTHCLTKSTQLPSNCVCVDVNAALNERQKYRKTHAYKKQ